MLGAESSAAISVAEGECPDGFPWFRQACVNEITMVIAANIVIFIFLALFFVMKR